MRIEIEVTGLEAASIMALLVNAAEAARHQGDDAQREIYLKLATNINETVKRTRANVEEAELLG